MKYPLSASVYEDSVVIYNEEFEKILTKVIVCYNLMLTDKVQLINDENSIRDVLLLNYLKDNTVRKMIALTDYLFDREVPEDRSIGRTDIKIQTLNTFEDTSAYYTIECKRINASNLNGTTGLNAKYIEKGICRFTSNTYFTYYKTNGMIGFVVESVDIDRNIANINALLTSTYTSANTICLVNSRNILSGFEYSYYSTHSIIGDEIIIYHLMFDFSKNMR